MCQEGRCRDFRGKLIIARTARRRRLCDFNGLARRRFFFARPKTNSIFFLSAFVFTHYTRMPPDLRRAHLYAYTSSCIIVSQRSRRVDSTAGLIRIRLAVFLRPKTMPNACLRGLLDRAFSLFLIPREFACKQHVRRSIIILYSRTVITTT